MKLCECGCGGVVNKITKTCTKNGLIKGNDRRFIHGHHKGNLGNHLSRVIIERIRQKNIGRKHTEEEKIKIGLGNKGKVVSIETKMKIGKANRGRKMSKETKEKLSCNHKGYHNSKKTEFKKDSIPWNKGKKMSPEGFALLQAGRKKLIFPIKGTSIEVKIQNFLKQLGIEFFTHQYIKIEHGYQCDILIPSMNLVIECDGNYWHKYPIGREIDHIRTSELIEKGFKVLRLWEFEINKMTIDEFNGRICAKPYTQKNI